MTSWRPPDGVVGDSAVIKVSVGMLGSAKYRCPAGDAMTARKNLRPLLAVERKPEALEQFTNGPFMAAMDLIERGGTSPEDALRKIDARAARGWSLPMHDGLRQWTTHAIDMYRQAFPGDDGQAMKPARWRWVYRKQMTSPDDRGAKLYQISVWGRCYSSADGKVRELRLLVNRLRSRVRTDAEVAVAALVLAEGVPGPVPERVRIVQFGILEGCAETLFDGTRESAVEMYRMKGKKALGDIVDSQEYRPGPACVECAYAAVCPALPRLPGLLGILDRTRPRRSWSATNGRTYRKCAAREHLRRHRLPVDITIERGAAAERGRAVHAYLERKHGADPPTPCGPHTPENWVADEFHLTDEDRRLGVRLLRHHAEVCPLRYARNAADVQAEPDLVFDDTSADLIVLAKPDLLYRDRGSWVWREVKTSDSDRRWSRDLVAEYPQLALAVVLIGRGALGSARGRVELEMLRPGGVDLAIIDPFTPGVRAAAENVLAEHVRDWHADDEFKASPGVECLRCEVGRWCSARESAGGVE
jgi:PD-(D/E)XK nuclease superfamily